MIMKFRSEQGVLAEALGALARIATSRNSATPTLAAVKLTLQGDTLTALSADNDISLQFTIPVGGEKDGVTLINARLLNEIIRALPSGKITVDVGADSASLSSGRSNFSVPVLNVVDFPRIPPSPANPVTMKAKDLSFALNQVVYAAGKDPARQNLTAVSLEAESDGLRLVATDGFRLAIRDLQGQQLLTHGRQCLIPARALNELQRLLDGAEDVSIRFGEIEVTFETGTMQLTTRIVNAEFPQYRHLVKPAYDNSMVIAREALLEALRRCRVLVDDDNTPFRLTMAPGSARFTVQSRDQGTSVEDVDATFEGTELTIAFNPGRLREGVEAIVGDEVRIQTIDNRAAALITGVGDDTYQYILMPQRI